MILGQSKRKPRGAGGAARLGKTREKISAPIIVEKVSGILRVITETSVKIFSQKSIKMPYCEGFSNDVERKLLSSSQDCCDNEIKIPANGI